jgi:type I restriction-modification system DNA methylase subunit
MDYISVKDAAVKFKLSERRIQKLCETHRIDGCQMISGVWLIPSNAAKPSDERFTDLPDNNDCISLKELCEELSISTATGRNWIKLEKLTPQYTQKKTPYFTKDYVSTLKNEIQSGKNTALKSRRNKKYVSGNALYRSYVSENCKNILILQELLRLIEAENIELTQNVIQYIIADCALHLFTNKEGNASSKDMLLKYLNHEIELGQYHTLVYDLIEDEEDALYFCKKYPKLFQLEYLYEPNEDVLGLIYISCKNIGKRKATGSYYTPTKVVRNLIAKLNIKDGQKILDPCCGTGNFLLQLPNGTHFHYIYGNDIDAVSVKICRLNIALKYPDADIEHIYTHITKLDYLTEYHKENFHYIIGNPPWGYDFSIEEKAQLKTLYRSTSGKNMESYDLFIERALSNLTPDGLLSYVLPEAILNVKAHSDIRRIILETSSIQYLNFLGNAFDGVQCPCIILQLTYTRTALSTVGMTVNNGKQEFKINTMRNVTPEYFSFITTDAEYSILEKIKSTDNISFLAGNADFALGIVTGNNKEYVSSLKTDYNEMVLKGSDVSKYHTNPSNQYIMFQPENFQQIAPTEMYRAPEKLLYRFICNQLVFAYDDKQTLSLNSCNIVIPRLEGIKMKYILAILNSRVAQFIYKKQFNSVKVLRSHIENIPIPIVNESIQDKIISLTDLLIQGQDYDSTIRLYEELDHTIFELFHLSTNEQQTIKDAVDGENKFLI